MLAAVIARVYRRLHWYACLWRGKVMQLAIRTAGGQCGRRIAVERGVHLRQWPSSSWDIGDGVYFGVGVIIDADRTARLNIGANSKVMHYSVIGSVENVSIGESVQIAEHCTIRDQNHDTSTGSMVTNRPVSAPLHVGSGTWIGRGSAILKGTKIGRGAVVGANSVVNSVIDDYAIVVGAPARQIGSRDRGAS